MRPIASCHLWAYARLLAWLICAFMPSCSAQGAVDRCGKPRILTGGDSGQAWQFLASHARALRRLGQIDRFYFAAFDPEALRLCRRLHINCMDRVSKCGETVRIAIGDPTLEDIKEGKATIDAYTRAIAWCKVDVIQMFTNQACPFVFSDLDVSWLREPARYFQNKPEHTVYTQRQLRTIADVGIMYFARPPAARPLIGAWAAASANMTNSPQETFQEQIQDAAKEVRPYATVISVPDKNATVALAQRTELCQACGMGAHSRPLFKTERIAELFVRIKDMAARGCEALHFKCNSGAKPLLYRALVDLMLDQPVV